MEFLKYLWSRMYLVVMGAMADRKVKSLIDADFRAFCDWIGVECNARNRARGFATHPELQSVIYARLTRKERVLGRVVFKGQQCCFIQTSDIGPGLMLMHGFSLSLNAERIGRDAVVCQQVTIGYSQGARPVIGDNCTICCGAKIVGGVTIGDNVTVAAGSVVVHDVPSDSVVAGNPARVVASNAGRRSTFPLE